MSMTVRGFPGGTGPSKWLARLGILAFCSISMAQAQSTERLMLSGEGIEDAVPWELYCTEGRQSGVWTQIPVPSHWEQQGFGHYNYGHDDNPSREQGIYRHRFDVPSAWRGRRVELVFEGVMTDAEVEINGQSAGQAHRGAFYPFRYDIGPLLRFGEENALQVTVSKHSADKRVNRAERDADYWIFGGIFRPVYLEARNPESIARWAIDARHDGAMTVDVFLHPPAAASELEWTVTDLAGRPLAASQRVPLSAGQEHVRLVGSFPGAEPWSAEMPRLHTLHLRLLRDGEPLHVERGRFGFRTFEARPGQGLLVNGRRVRLKGINRHVFWPASGRATWPRRDVLDVEALKALNLNAVRTAHYPPDRAFLDACDELGLYVLDELGGWHDAYGTERGQRLVEAMVTRDVNHPSILFWDNGNEGGWNVALDDAFGRWDPQGRPVLHPDERLGILETRHYPHRRELAELLDDATWRGRWWGLRPIEPPLVMPTELLHGLYDGGSGAGLDTFWDMLRQSPRGVGAFLWSFTDESIERRDRDGVLDSDGNHAPDGVLGPYREWSGTASAVREVFSPIVIGAPARPGFDGTLKVENRYDHIPLSQSRFVWQLMRLPTAHDPHGALPRLVTWGEVDGPAIAPGAKGHLRLPLDGASVLAADVLRLTAYDAGGRDVMTWVWPLRELYFRSAVEASDSPPTLAGGGVTAQVVARQEGDVLHLSSGPHGVEIDLRQGALLALLHRESRWPLAGPWPLSASGDGAEPDLASLATGDGGRVRHYAAPASHVVEAVGAGAIRRLRWSLHGDGWLRLSYLYQRSDAVPFHGIDFPLEPSRLAGLRWLGHGPSRVWANRRQGAALGLWTKERQGQTAPIWGHEPKLDGYYGGVRWAALQLRQDDGQIGELQVAFEAPGLDLGILTPPFVEDAEDARAEVPRSGLAVFGEIPPIGTKFHPAADLVPPTSQPPGGGLARGVLWLRWRPRS